MVSLFSVPSISEHVDRMNEEGGLLLYQAKQKHTSLCKQMFACLASARLYSGRAKIGRAERKAVCFFLSTPPNRGVIFLFSLKSVAMHQEQTPWKGAVYADSPGLEVYPIQMKTDVHSNLARNQRIYERDKIIKIISMNHQYLVWRTGFFVFVFLENTAGNC